MKAVQRQAQKPQRDTWDVYEMFVLSLLWFLSPNHLSSVFLKHPAQWSDNCSCLSENLLYNRINGVKCAELYQFFFMFLLLQIRFFRYLSRFEAVNLGNNIKKNKCLCAASLYIWETKVLTGDFHTNQPKPWPKVMSQTETYVYKNPLDILEMHPSGFFVCYRSVFFEIFHLKGRNM